MAMSSLPRGVIEPKRIAPIRTGLYQILGKLAKGGRLATQRPGRPTFSRRLETRQQRVEEEQQLVVSSFYMCPKVNRASAKQLRLLSLLDYREISHITS